MHAYVLKVKTKKETSMKQSIMLVSFVAYFNPDDGGSKFL
jgi:hypothetical protein